MLKITQDNYGKFKQVYEILWQFQAVVSNLDANAEYSPINVLTSWERQSKSLALRGLKEGLRDSLTMLMDLPPDLQNNLNDQLTNKGLPSFNELVSIIKNTPTIVLKRKRIKNIDEYYIIKEVINDLSYDISETERVELEKIFWDFEQIDGKTKKAN